jgi:hypothetical protein
VIAGGIIVLGVVAVVRSVFRWFMSGTAAPSPEPAYPGDPIAGALKNKTKIKIKNNTEKPNTPPTPS